MAQITGFTAAKMQELYNASIIAARRAVDNVVLTTRGGTDIDLGSFKGTPGTNGTDGVNLWTTATQLATVGNSVSAIVPDAVAGVLIKVGDTVLSRHSASNGLYGVVTAVASQSSVTVQTSASLVGPQGPVGTPVASWWRGVGATTFSHTSGNWRSFNLGTKSDGENLVMPAPTGDCFIPPAGVYDITAQINYTNSGTGFRKILLILNPGSNTFNSTTYPSGTGLVEDVTPAVAGSNVALKTTPRRVRVNGTTDKIIICGWQDSTGTMTIPNGAFQTFVNFNYVGA